MLKAPVCEIFKSIQGEGYGIGIPCVFVRLWGCNLRCTFAGKECDTPYSVYDGATNSDMKTALTVANKIKVTGLTHIVWTGGEPMLHQNFIYEVMAYLNNKVGNFSCEIETNGTIPISNKHLLKFVNWYNISIKLKSSNQNDEQFEDMRINHTALKSFPTKNSFFKFVYCNKSDLQEIFKLKNRYDMPIYLMPEGVDREAIIEHSPEVVNICINNNFRFSPREHITIWDKKRGV